MFYGHFFVVLPGENVCPKKITRLWWPSGPSCHVSNSSRVRRLCPSPPLGITILIVRNGKQFIVIQAADVAYDIEPSVDPATAPSSSNRPSLQAPHLNLNGKVRKPIQLAFGYRPFGYRKHPVTGLSVVC